ncbi:16S rRNA (uracil(1498)-N(3))-methyltransferase [Flavicella sediminum]|uniref:16S rRNA (uracil(1498)-N(3))-methyltransferase n=1 Tax=Flavicella sediminum TaxID=2585141 RepID=UPI0011224A08|nr:16S rRNA (uracil(1498)-N(3))-methyltransferase [Flavicella sediminum]
MQLFFNATLSLESKEFKFDKTESRHIVRVLRKKEGDLLNITNGQGALFTAEVLVANDKNCLVKIVKVEEKQKPWNYHLHIAIAPTKLNDRIEWFLEKATEIGIDEITPIICHHSERKVVKLERFEKIILSAMKQSLKFHLPKINEAVTFKQFLAQQQNGALFIAHCEEQEKKSFKNEIAPDTDITILIGPEGDFSPKEIELALSKNFQAVSLGESRLRTETAALVACHSVAFVNEK